MSSSATEEARSSNNLSSNNTRLQPVNYANVAGYIANTVIVFGAQFVGLQDNATMSEKYQTLVTPSGYAFSIWGIIFLAQLIWTIAQLLPMYRSNELVIKGVGYNYVWACVAQCVWTIAFGLEQITISLVAMVLILIPLLIVLTRTSNMPAESIGQYWLLKFPFEIHAAWIMAATVVNTNVVVLAYTASSNVPQIMVGWASLALVALVGLYYTIMKEQRWVVPSVLAWASTAIAVELSNPKELIVSTFTESTIQQTRIAAGFVAALLLVAMIAKLVYNRFWKPASTTSSTTNNEDQYTAL